MIEAGLIEASLEAPPEPLSPAELSVLEAILAALGCDKSLAELLVFITPFKVEAVTSSEPSGIICGFLTENLIKSKKILKWLSL